MTFLKKRKVSKTLLKKIENKVFDTMIFRQMHVRLIKLALCKFANCTSLPNQQVRRVRTHIARQVHASTVQQARALT